MGIPFKHIPSNLRVPLFYAEVDNSMANTGGQNQRALIIGQVTSTGLAPANIPLRCQGLNDAKTQGGVGSMLHLMTEGYLQNDPFGELWYLPLADAGAGTAATATLTVSAQATTAGTIYLYIAGQLVVVPVATTDVVATIATNINAAINAITSLPVTSTVATAVVTITAKNKGICGNEINITFNYRGAANGEVMPAGLTIACNGTASGSGYQLASGATNPTLTTALANLGSMTFDFIASPYTDATSTSALTTFLNDSTGRWCWAYQLYGGVFMAFRGTLGATQSFGLTLNDQHTSCLGFYDSPTPGWIIAAQYCGACAGGLKVDPAQPLQTLPIYGMLAPPIQNRFLISGQNSLLWSGISTFTVDVAGLCYIQNACTTYQLNSFGQSDDSYLEVETMYTLVYILRFLAMIVTSKYARVKLAADNTAFAPGSAIVTPKIVKSDLIAGYNQLVYDGFAQKPEVFAAGLIVAQNSTNPNRLDVLYDPVLIDQLRVFALLAQFRLK